jgi:hypothetical protein
MANNTQMKMIEVIDKFIKYMLTEQDGGKVIYQHLLEQTEENLEDWVSELKQWLVNGNEYTYTDLFCNNCGYDEECECEVKEPVEDEFTITSITIIRYINYMIDREVEKQMEEMEMPDPLPVQQQIDGSWKAGRTTARGWFFLIQGNLQEQEKRNFYDNIFSNCRELLEVIDILKNYYNEFDTKINNNFEEFMLKYCYMYISQMEATDLKQYIINLLDPVEPK